jgi:hypothetical protein
MPYFSLSLNSAPWEILGGNNYSYFEIGMISVGPIFDIDIVCNGLERGKSDITPILNKKLKVGDVVLIIPHENKIDKNTKESPHLNPGAAPKEVGVKSEINTKMRALRVNIDGQQDFVIKAINNTTMSCNCTWVAKRSECMLTLGNTNYENIEQWLQMNIDFDQVIQISVY